VLVVFCEAHAASHRFWDHAGLGDSRPSRDPQLRGALAQVYGAIDAEIEGLMRRAPDACVFVVSNQGIRDGTPDAGLTRLVCQRLGYLHQRPGHGRGAPLDGVRRRLGRWGISGAADPLAGVDWSRTRAFPIPSSYAGLIRINLRGREPEGCVAPEEYDAEVARIEADLSALVDARSGIPAAERVVRTAEAFGATQPPRGLPDLFVFWAARPRGASELIHPRARLRVRTPRYARLNQHARGGLVVAAGPSIRAKGDLGRVEPEDLAPAFRCALGRAAPGDSENPFASRAFDGSRPRHSGAAREGAPR